MSIKNLSLALRRSVGAQLLCALLLCTAPLTLACNADDVEESLEEIEDEVGDMAGKVEDKAKDAKDEIEDEIDDMH